MWNVGLRLLGQTNAAPAPVAPRAAASVAAPVVAAGYAPDQFVSSLPVLPVVRFADPTLPQLGALPVLPTLPDLTPVTLAPSAPLPTLQPVSAPSAPAPAPQAEEPKKEAPKSEGSGPLLMKGHAGEPVKKLQERLKELGFDPGPADGIFGPKTLEAVKAFQAAKGLETDGKVGPKTWNALGIVVTGQPHEARPAGSPNYPESNGIVNTPDGPMVRRQGTLIGAAIAGQFDAMVEAARKDGVTLKITSGYRSYEEQVVAWNKYGRNPARVARPGTSNHQKGTAIDFGNIGNAYAWLKRNSTRFGFHNYDPEPWHYSLNGR